MASVCGYTVYYTIGIFLSQQNKINTTWRSQNDKATFG